MRRVSLERAVFAGAASAVLAACGFTATEPRTAFNTSEARFLAATDENVAHADTLLAARLSMALKTDPMTQASNIQVTVDRGHARLSGFAHNAAARLRAMQLAQQADGVIAVENRLILRYHAGLAPDPLGNSRVHL